MVTTEGRPRSATDVVAQPTVVRSGLSRTAATMPAPTRPPSRSARPDASTAIHKGTRRPGADVGLGASDSDDVSVGGEVYGARPWSRHKSDSQLPPDGRWPRSWAYESMMRLSFTTPTASRCACPLARF